MAGFFGEIPLVMHCAKSDVQVRLLNVAYVCGVNLILFSLLAVTQMHEFTLNLEGVHLLGGDLTFPCRAAGFYVEASRIADAPIVAGVVAPEKMMRIDVNDLHVSYAHSHADTLCETARQMRVKVFRYLVSCSGCSATKEMRVAVPWTTGCRSTRPLERVFVDLSGKRPTSAGGAQCLMIVDDYSRMGWPYFLKRKSDVTADVDRLLADVNGTGVPSTVE